MNGIFILITLFMFSELTSPGYPGNFTVKSAQTINCQWEVRPRDGTKISMRVLKINVNYECDNNKLEVFSTSGDSMLSSQKFKSGNDTFKMNFKKLLLSQNAIQVKRIK